MVPGRQSAMVMELAPLRMPLARGVAAKGWSRFRAFLVTATPIMLVGSFCLGLLVESGLWAPLASALEPASRWLLGLPAIVTVAIGMAILRKELALQLLVVFGVLGVGTAAATADPGRPADAGTAVRLRHRGGHLDPLRGHAGGPPGGAGRSDRGRHRARLAGPRRGRWRDPGTPAGPDLRELRRPGAVVPRPPSCHDAGPPDRLAGRSTQMALG